MNYFVHRGLGMALLLCSLWAGWAEVAFGQGVPSISVNSTNLVEGNAGTVTAFFTLTLSSASAQTVTVDFSTAPGTATPGVDYLPADGTATFDPGVTFQTVQITIYGDALNEANETFSLVLANAVEATLEASEAVATILDDDPLPALTINDITSQEGDTTPIVTTFTVSLSAVSGQDVSVWFWTVDGTAAIGSDVYYTSGFLTLLAGETNGTILVLTMPDIVNEADEIFYVNLSNPINATLTRTQGVGTVQNDDPSPALTINDISVLEGNAGTSSANFTIRLSAISGQTVTVNYETAPGTASAGSDYLASTGVITFPPGTTNQTATISVLSDTLNEANETFTVNLSVPVNATVLDGQGTATIFNDDPAPSISINDVTLMEGDSGTTNAVFTVILSAASGQTVTMNYATANGTATAGADYIAAAGTVTFTPGTTSQSMHVGVNGDLLNETSETFFVNLYSPVNASLARIQGAGTIQNDDAVPSISINDVTTAEGNFGTGNAVFTVSLSAASGQAVTVNYATANGTATAGSDYGSSGGTLAFDPGVMSQSVSVTINGDSVYEANETFLVNLSAAVSATILDAQGQGTIVNDDSFPAISISDVTVVEGNGGTTNAVFAVSLSAGSSQTITVSYAITDGTAIAGSDYVSGVGTITFGPGVTSQTIAVDVNGDLLNESNETFGVNLSGAVNATILDGEGAGMIVNDDGQPALSISDVTLVEGNSGTTNVSFAVTLSAASGQTVTLSYTTANVTAIASSDYTAVSGTVTFAPGVISQSIIVPVIGDLLNEPNESFVVNLAGVVNATAVKSQGAGTIQNDDAAPSISINDVTITEGNSGTVNAAFTVSLSAASGQTVTVNYATANGTAASGSDYGSSVGTATFAPGATTQMVSVDVNGDSLYEANETFFVNLSGAVNATVLDAQGQGTISNDDGFPAVSISDVAVVEGNGGTTNAVFAVSLSAGSSQTVTVSYATADGTAAAGSDYVSGAGTVTFGAGVTSQMITVVVNGDLLNEINEAFYVNLSGAVNATVADGQGLGTIVDDDGQPALSISDVTLVEGNSGTTNEVFVVSLSAVSGQTVTVNYATANGTATAGTDFVATSGVLSFAPGMTNRTATVVVNGDITYEADETFQVSLSGAVNAGIGRNQALGTIINDDPLPAIAINDVTLWEGNTSSTNAVFTVSLSRPSAFGVSLNFASADGSAKSGVDYSSTVGGLYFSPGITNQSITVAIIGDTMNEANETFLVNLSNPGNATLSDGQGVGTIVNEDPVPAVSIPDTLLLEGDSGTTNLTFTLTLTSVSGQTVTVDYATQNGSAVAPADYAVASGRVVFSPGATSQTVPVTVSGDLLNEADETLFFNLSNPTNASLTRNQGVGTIQNNDPIPGIYLADAAVLEGDTGTTGLIFPVMLSAPSGRAVSANYYLVDGTAASGIDYVSSSGAISFPSGSTNQTVVVAVKGDTLFEPNENLFIRLTNAVNGNLVITQAMGTIVENESRTLAYTNTAEIQIPSFKIINPYPTSINLSGVPGMISKVTVSLFGLWHDSPDDLDLLLVGPAGQKVLIMSDSGGANPVYGVNLTLNDSASALPDSGQINAGTFRPTDFAPADSFPSPAPAGPYATQLGAFAGADPNGTWSLYVYDDTFGLGGVLSNGWAIAVTTTNLICCGVGADADLSVTVTDTPDPALTGNAFTYSLVVVNSGPANATGVVVTNTLPPGTTYIGASSSQGTCSYESGVVTCALGNLPLASSARIAITVSCPSTGMLTNLTRVTGSQTDLNPANNAAAATTSVILAPPYLSIRDVTVLEPNLMTTNAGFIVSLSKATNQTITVDYTTVNGTATAGPDFLPTYGSLTFGPGVTNQTITVSVSGDGVVEPSETFSVTLTNPANAKISRATGQGTILNDDAAVGLINRFVWDPLPTTQYYGIPFAVGIRAVDVNGMVVSGFNGSADLLGLVGAAGTNSILITEVDTSVDRVEFANVTQLPVDISGWEISCYDWLMWPDPKVVLTVPEGTVVPAGSLFSCQDGGVYPGAFPNFSLGDNLAWMNDPGTNQVAVLLRNRGGQVVDFMGAVDAYSSEISYPLPITAAEWSGAPVAANPDPTQTYQRIGAVDRNSNADWSVSANSMGVQNAGLTLPFAGPRPVLISPANSGNFAAGIWAGNATVLGIATNMYMRADDRDGHVGSSGQFTIQPTTDLAVNTSASASLITAGQDVIYTSVVTNQGSFGTSGVTFTNRLSGSATYVSAFTTLGTISQSGNEVIASLGSMAVNTSARITITIRGSSPGSITNTALVSASLRDYLTNNNSTVVISRVNYPPTISALSDVTINEDNATGPISFTVSDPETPAASLVVMAVTSDTNIVPNANIVMGGSGAARTIALTPIPNRFGDVTNTISVSDGLEISRLSFVLHVLPVNDPPVLNVIADRNIPELTLLSFTNTAVDLDQEPLTYSLGPGAPPGALVNPQTGVFTWTPSEAQGPGTNFISIKVQDSAGSSDSRSFTVVVTDVNSVPRLPSLPAVGVAELSQLIVTNTPVDSDIPTNTLVLQLVDPPAGMSINTVGRITWTPSEQQGPGVYTVTTLVTDNGSPPLNATNSFIVTVTETNRVPTLPIQANRAISELAPFSIDNAATDTDIPANVLTYQLLNPPTGATIDASGTITWTPTEGQGPGTYVLQTVVTDNGAPRMSATNSFSVTVNEANTAPSLPAQVNRVVNEITALVVSNNATDADFPANALTYQLLNAPVGASINSQGTITWTPTEAQGPGSYSLATVVIDSGVPPLSDTNVFTVTVHEANAVPILPLQTNLVVDELTALVIINGATDTDLPPGSLSYQLLSPPAGANIDPQGKITWTPTEAQGPGNYTLATVATDNGSPPHAATNSFIVTVREVNTAPILTAQAAKSVIELTSLIVNNGATDGDLPLDVLSYQLINAPAGAAIDGRGLITWTPTEGQGPGTYTLRTVVVDNGDPQLSVTNSFAVTVSEVNRPPALPVQANLVINELTTLRVTNSAVDGDIPSNNLTYHMVDPPAGATISAQGIITWTPSEAQGPGTYTISAVVTDDGSPNTSATNDFTVSVKEVNTVPGLPALTNRTLVELTELSVANAATDTDLPADSLTYQLFNPPSGASIDSSGNIRWTPSEQQGPGNYTITTLVTDNGMPSLGATNSFVVTVSETNGAPVLRPIGEQSVRKTTLLTFTVQANEPDIPVQTVTYSLDPGAPSGATINSVSGVFTWTPTSAQGPSTNFLTVRAADNGTPSMSDAELIRIVVTDSNLPPVLTAIPAKTADEGSLLTFTTAANDGDVPAQTLSYALDPGAPVGASINAATGVFTWTPSESAGPSTNYLVVRVVDNGNPPASDSQTVTIVVNEVNGSPLLPPLTGRSVTELSTLTITNTATDPDIPRSSMVYRLVDPPVGAAIDQNGIITWTPTETQGPGGYNLTTIANDTGVPPLGVTNTVFVTVMEANQAPILSAQGDHSINELATLTVTNAAVDTDLPANVLNYQLLSPPTGANINGQGVIVWTPNEVQGPGAYELVTVVTDSGNPSLSATNSFTVTVVEVNLSPMLPVQIDRSVNEMATILVTNTATDADLPANLMTYQLINPPGGAAIGADGVITWVPSEADGPGTNRLVTVVTDNGMPPLSATNAFNVVVAEVNSAPVLAVQASRMINELTPITVNNAASDSDSPPNSISYRLVSPPVGASIDPAGTISWTPSENQGPGTHVITTIATDLGSPPLSSTNSFSVVVNEVNSAPSLSGRPDRFIDEFAVLTVTNAATDVDAPANAKTYALLDAPAGASIDSNGVISWSPSEVQGPGSFTLTTMVADDGTPSLNAVNSFVVTVREVNGTPSLPVQADRSAIEGTQLLINNAATDSDIPSNLLIYKLLNPPTGASIDGDGMISWNVPNSGNHTLATVVTDNGTPPMSATNSFSVTVVETNSPPALGFQLNRVINELTELLVTNAATDPDIPPNHLSYQLISPPSGASINSAGVIHWIPTELQGQGNYVITTVVRDDVSPPLSATNSFSVTVLEVNRAPTLDPVQDQTIYAGQTLWITNSSTDPDLPANSLIFAHVSGPQGAAITEAGLFSWTPGFGFVGTTNSVTISVSDSGVPTLTDTKSFRVFVNEAAELRMDITIRQSGIIAISWGSVVGTVYRVEFKDRMEDPQWQTLEEVLAISSQCVATDEARSFQRFYRVKVLR